MLSASNSGLKTINTYKTRPMNLYVFISLVIAYVCLDPNGPIKQEPDLFKIRFHLQNFIMKYIHRELDNYLIPGDGDKA